MATELDRMRLNDLFTKAYEQVEQDATTYTYNGRHYRVREVTVTIAEMHTKGGGWVPLPQVLTDHLLHRVASGDAVLGEP